MPAIERLSLSLEKPLCDRIDRMMRHGHYASRSDLFRDLIRSRAVEETWDHDQPALGTITLVYDHDQRTLSRKLMSLQHHHHGNVLATTHVHLDAHLCAEMIMVTGRAGEIRRLADELGHQKGVLHSGLTMSSAEPDAGSHTDDHHHSHGEHGHAGHSHPHSHSHASPPINRSGKRRKT